MQDTSSSDGKKATPRRPSRPLSYRSEAKRAAKSVRKIEKRLAAAQAAGDEHRAHGLKRLMLNSQSAKIVAVETSNARAKPKTRLRRSRRKALAYNLSPHEGTHEPVTVLAKWRLGKEPRIYNAFGPEHRALQTLVVNAIRTFIHVDARQYLSVGVDAAVRAAMDDLGTTWKYVAELDIKDFYPSVETDHIKRLVPCGDRITDAVIALEEAEREYPPSWAFGGLSAIVASNVRGGLPQGSISSPIVAEAVIAEIFAALPEGAPVINYGDNFLVKGRTKEEVEATIKTLVAAIRASAGRFSITSTGVRKASEGFKWLGYQIKTRRGVADAVATSENLKKFELKIIKHIRALLRGRPRTRALKRYVQSWSASFSLWKERDFWIWSVLNDYGRGVPEVRRELEAAMQPALMRARNALLTYGADA